MNAATLRRYAEYGLRPGVEVIKLTLHACGRPMVYLFRYDTAASFTVDGWERSGWTYTRELVPWDGETEVELYAGD